MKKLTLLLAVTGIGSIMYGQQKEQRSFLDFAQSQDLESKRLLKPDWWKRPAWWMRPKTYATMLIKESEPIPTGYIVDTKFRDIRNPAQTLVRVYKKLPISTKEEFWNKFISGYGDDKFIEEEMRMKNKFPTRDEEKARESERKKDPGISERSWKRYIEENEFLRGVEKETPQHYVKPAEAPKFQPPLFIPYEQKAATGFFSGWRNWWNNLWKPKNTPTYAPTRPISVPLKSSESE